MDTAGTMCPPDKVAKHSVTMQADAVTSALVAASRSIHDIDSITHNRVRRSRRAFERDSFGRARDGSNIRLPQRSYININLTRVINYASRTMNLGVKLTPDPPHVSVRIAVHYWDEFDHRRRDAAPRISLQRDVNMIFRRFK